MSCVCMCLYACAWACVFVCVHVSVSFCIYLHVCVCEHVCLSLCGGMCVEEKLLPEQFIPESSVSTTTQQWQNKLLLTATSVGPAQTFSVCACQGSVHFLCGLPGHRLTLEKNLLFLILSLPFTSSQRGSCQSCIFFSASLFKKVFSMIQMKDILTENRRSISVLRDAQIRVEVELGK